MWSSVTRFQPMGRRWTSWSRSKIPTRSTNRFTWRDAGTRFRTSVLRWSAQKTTKATISAGTCFQYRAPTHRIFRTCNGGGLYETRCDRSVPSFVRFDRLGSDPPLWDMGQAPFHNAADDDGDRGRQSGDQDH